MSEYRSLDSLTKDDKIAGKVRRQLEVFPQKFRELGEGGQLSELFRSPKKFSGARVEQAPEVFTEQYLIGPVLHGLGYLSSASAEYDGSGPHFIRQPITYRKVEPKQPDYLLKNIDPAIVCIVEAKAVNRERMTGAKTRASDDIQDYLEEDAFCKFLRDLDQRYLVGIGTDGFRWTLWMKDIHTGEERRHNPKVDISDVVRKVASRRNVIEGSFSSGASDEREHLAEEFVPAFAAENLPKHVKSVFEEN
ncbi:hypothetical protein ABNG02_02010 [Halorubrum ejinorense]|uniref:Uncharacterized protein n=1 Tax=Halorubrum ejinorense TaxID=425309 RepID=A0AAV3SNJ8_9EURY